MIQDLQLCMDLESISQVEFQADYLWHLTAECANCQEQFQDLFCRVSETEPIPNSRGEAHCTVKCKLCERHGSIKIRSSGAPITYTLDHSGKFLTLVSFECRGLVLISWIPDSNNNQITARGLSSNAIYDDVNLNEEFFEYDEGAGVPVAITEIRQRFVQGK